MGSTGGRHRYTPVRPTRPTEPPLRPGRLRPRPRGLIAQHPTGVIETPFGVVWDMQPLRRSSSRTHQPRHGAPEPVAPGPAQRHPRTVRGGAGLLAGAGLRHLATSRSSPATRAGSSSTRSPPRPRRRRCLELANQHLGERPVIAVIYTHRHLDHFGGVLGVTTQADVDAGRCRSSPPSTSCARPSARTCSPAYAMIRRALVPVRPAPARRTPAARRLRARQGDPASARPGLIVPTRRSPAPGGTRRRRRAHRLPDRRPRPRRRPR